MGQFVQDQWTIKDQSVVNGNEARATDPWWLDNAQKYLISGESWHVPTISDVNKTPYPVSGTAHFPLYIRPWTGAIGFMVRGILTDEAGTVDITINRVSTPPTTLTELGLTNISLDHDDLITQTEPTTETGWQAIDWYGVGVLGSSTPSGTGKWTIQLTPSNAWTEAWIKLDLSNAVVHDVAIRTFVSQNELT
jgi:hypothetical protein